MLYENSPYTICELVTNGRVKKWFSGAGIFCWTQSQPQSMSQHLQSIMQVNACMFINKTIKSSYGRMFCLYIACWTDHPTLASQRLNVALDSQYHTGPVMYWWPVQGVHHFSTSGSWDRLQPPCDPELDEVGIENGWMFYTVLTLQIKELMCP